MDCAQCQEALSARLDGEVSAVDWGAIDAHLAMCAVCRRFAAKATRLTSLVHTVVAAPELDVLEAILREESGPWWLGDRQNGGDVRTAVAAARWCGCPCCRRLTGLLRPSP
ncbi:MAG TPA: zf-HC2 domain-containing protein [Pseudonocardiaceae bacterium]|nr:zf-HC2 domain-containing protein [Pseudonocardiaceae bacterium]